MLTYSYEFLINSCKIYLYHLTKAKRFISLSFFQKRVLMAELILISDAYGEQESCFRAESSSRVCFSNFSQEPMEELMKRITLKSLRSWSARQFLKRAFQSIVQEQSLRLAGLLTQLQREPNFSQAFLIYYPSCSSLPVVFLKMKMRLLAMMFSNNLSIRAGSTFFSVLIAPWRSWRRLPTASSVRSGGDLVITHPTLLINSSGNYLNISKKPDRVFFQSRGLVLVFFYSMKSRIPTSLHCPNIMLMVNFWSNEVHFLSQGGSQWHGTSTMARSSPGAVSLLQTAGRTVCILIVLAEMTPSWRYLSFSKMRPGLLTPCWYLLMSSKQVDRPVLVYPMKRTVF